MHSFDIPKNKIEAGNKEEKFKKIVADLFERGLDDENCIGFHGTSLESIEYLMKNGHLPGQVEEDEKYGYGKGEFFFYPKGEVFSGKESPFKEEFESDKEIMERAESYANVLSQTHYIIAKLELDLGNPKHQYIGRVLQLGLSDEAEDMIDDFIKKGKTKKEIYKILNESKNRKGVVIGIDKKVFDGFQCKVGHPSDEDGNYLHMNCATGMDIIFITGIEPMGQQEWDYLTELQKRSNVGT